VRFKGRWVAKGAAFLVLVLIAVAVLSYVVMSLWNAIVVHLFQVPMLEFWQAVGLLILCRILFGGFRGRGHGWHSHGRGGRGHWRRHWENMTPEERERLRAKMKQRCGWYPDEPPAAEQPNSNRPA